LNGRRYRRKQRDLLCWRLRYRRADSLCSQLNGLCWRGAATWHYELVSSGIGWMIVRVK